MAGQVVNRSQGGTTENNLLLGSSLNIKLE